MALPTLDDGHRLLVCLAVAIKRRDPVLVRQVAEKADKVLPDSQIRRAFSRLRQYGIGDHDLAWLQDVDI